nr:MAG: hypothetical protein [Caudoviricetes sp.]
MKYLFVIISIVAYAYVSNQDYQFEVQKEESSSQVSPRVQ